MVSSAQDNDKIVQKAITMHANREQCLERKKFLIEIIPLLGVIPYFWPLEVQIVHGLNVALVNCMFRQVTRVPVS